MSAGAFIDCRFEINAVVVSSYTKSVTLPIEFEALDDTAFGDIARSRVAGIQDSTLGGTFNQDFANAALDATLWAAFSGRVPVVCKVRPTTAAIGTSNPEYVGSYLPTQHNPFGNTVGELAATQISWPLSDPDGIARNTT